MAKTPNLNEPDEKEWTPESIRIALRKIRRRLADVITFDALDIKDRADPKITSLEIAIRSMLADVFGSDRRLYREFQSASSLDTAGLSMSGPNDRRQFVDGLVRGKERSVTLLNRAIQLLEEKMADDFPGDPLDVVELAGRATTATSGGLIGVEAKAMAGNVSVSIQNETAPGAVIVADNKPEESSYEQLQIRVALLESSLGALRGEIDSQARRAREIGVGHNQGPDFAPASAEELNEIDDLIALLKAQGASPPTDTAELMQRSERAQSIADKIKNALFVLGAEIAKGAAREAGKEMLIPLWSAVSDWIFSLGPIIKTWLKL